MLKEKYVKYNKNLQWDKDPVCPSCGNFLSVSFMGGTGESLWDDLPVSRRVTCEKCKGTFDFELIPAILPVASIREV